MRKTVVRGALFAAMMGAGACAVSDAPEVENDETKLEEIEINVEESIESKADMAASAATYLANNLTAVGAGHRFEVLGTGKRVNGQPYLRMKQVYQGVPVFGAEVIVRADNNAFSSANGQVLPGLSSLKLQPAMAKASALEAAKADYLSKVTDKAAALSYSREKTQLVILPLEGQRPRLAWHVTFFTELQGGREPGLWNYFIDAQDGSIVKSFNAVHALSQASGPGGNAKVPRTWTNALDVEPSGAQFMMDTAKLITVNMNNGTSGGTTVTGPLSPIGDAPINDAHGFAEVTLNYMLDWYGYNSINNAGFKIRSRVHYSSNYENAFWDGSQMTYGDGASTFYPLSGDLGVVAHEINHGFTSYNSNLTYSGQSGGANESFSDIASEIAEAYYENGSPDWLIGPDIYKSATGALRYMCNPTQDGRSVDNVANITAGMDVHFSSGVGNKAFCLASRILGSGSATGAATAASTRRAGQAWYVANDQHWTASSNYQSICTGIWNAATALSFTTAEKCALRDAWIGVGVTCGDATLCGGTPPPPPPPGNSYAYSATNTNSAQQNTVNRTIALTAGQVLTIGTCQVTGSAFTGDTYLRLYGTTATQVASNDDACGGRGSLITYTATATGNYEIRGGCYTTGSCTGTVAWTISAAPPPPTGGNYSYSATNTNSAQQNTVNQSVTLAAGQKMTLGTCGMTGSAFTGDTYLRVYSSAGTQVASNDDACGGRGSQLTYTATTAGTFQIRGGCYSSGSCTGTAVWTIQ